MTNARLGAGGTDWERRLTSRLRPVREVLDVSAMNFDQLLQRDLDDHRIATELIPYLLRESSTGPAFFPPILALLLPFGVAGEASFFPVPESSTWQTVDELPYEETLYGDAYQVRRLGIAGAEELNPIRFGTMAWNDERAKVVVLDGQHRAMALLAIDRTLHHSWDEAGRGARYRHFYESRVQAALDEYGEIEMVQVPVTVCWLPQWVGPDRLPHLAARKLFVDVNREAKPPSFDRVVLLSDDDLLNIFTRTVLNTLRAEDTDPPLYAIEYDNPSPSGRPVRWSAIASLQAVRNMVNRVIFGPEKYVTRLDEQIRGRESPGDRDAFMRRQLRIRDLLPHEVVSPSGVSWREEISQRRFPQQQVDLLIREFSEGWGAGLIYLFGHLLPFAAHYQALREIDDTWEAADPATVDALAREAAFEGLGMYWILRDSFEHWQNAGGRPASDGVVPDIVQAWERLRAKGVEFRRVRAARYMESSDPESVELAEGVFSVVNTQAAQVGLSLLLATLCEKAGVLGGAVVDVAVALTEALNVALRTETPQGLDRRVCLSQTARPPINLIGDMNTPRAAEFRYLWLELLCLEEALARFLTEVDRLEETTLKHLRDSARSRFFSQLVSERITERRRYDRSLSRQQLEMPVSLEVLSALENALATWFLIDPADVRSWASSASLATPDEDEEDETGTEEGDEAS